MSIPTADYYRSYLATMNRPAVVVQLQIVETKLNEALRALRTESNFSFAFDPAVKAILEELGYTVYVSQEDASSTIKVN